MLNYKHETQAIGYTSKACDWQI